MVKKRFIFISLLATPIFFWSVLPCFSQKLMNFDTDRGEDTLHYDGPNFWPMGLPTPFYISAVRFTPEVAGTLMAIIFYHWDSTTLTGNAYVYDEGTQTNPGPLVRIEPYSVTGQGWHRINLSTSYPYIAGVDFWTAIEINGYPDLFPMGVDSGPAVDGRGDWISLDGATWTELQDYGLDYNWNIRAIVHTEGGGIEETARGETRRPGEILQVYPNPFRTSLVIKYTVSSKHQEKSDKEVPTAYSLLPTIHIYDATGRLVKSFLLATCYSLLATAVWQGDDDFGRKLPPGIYFCYFVSGRNQIVKSVIKLY